MQVQSLLSGAGRTAEYIPFKPTVAVPQMSYNRNLNADGNLPEPVWCVDQQSSASMAGKACSTGGLFQGSVAS
jgi:hypothetical protein